MKKKFLFTALVLLAANSFVTSSRAADSCPYLVLTNASGSPRVVTGTTVQFWFAGLSPVADFYLDGSWAGAAYDAFLPPNTLFSSYASIPNLSIGAHTLRAGWDTCTVNFTVVPFPSAPTMTQGYSYWEGWSPDPFEPPPTYIRRGFQRNVIGAMDPVVTSNNKTYEGLSDLEYCPNWYSPCTRDSSFSVSGWTSDPGKGWLKSITANGRTKTGASANYYYMNGQANWLWNDTFEFTGVGTTQVEISHD